MKSGKYVYLQRSLFSDVIIGRIMIDVKVTAKSYNIKLLENTTYLDYDHFALMFKSADTIRINRNKSPHAISEYTNGFVIYPYRAGIPFAFDYVKENA